MFIYEQLWMVVLQRSTSSSSTVSRKATKRKIDSSSEEEEESSSEEEEEEEVWVFTGSITMQSWYYKVSCINGMDMWMHAWWMWAWQLEHSILGLRTFSLWDYKYGTV